MHQLQPQKSNQSYRSIVLYGRRASYHVTSRWCANSSPVLTCDLLDSYHSTRYETQIDNRISHLDLSLMPDHCKVHLVEAGFVLVVLFLRLHPYRAEEDRTIVNRRTQFGAKSPQFTLSMVYGKAWNFYLRTKNRSIRASTRKRKISILLFARALVLMLASRPFSRWNKK